MKVLDTSGILRSYLDFSKNRYVISNSVLDELRDETAKTAVESAIRSGNVKVMDPSKDYVKQVVEAAEKIGELGRLSRTDIEVLALALEKKIAIVTDDYSIQNVASLLKLEYETCTHEGIKHKLKWFKVCVGCGRRCPYDSVVCDVCGSDLKMKASRL